MACNKELQQSGAPAPRTCVDCRLGPCKNEPHKAQRHPQLELAHEWMQDMSKPLQWLMQSPDGWVDWVPGSSVAPMDPSKTWRFKPEPKPNIIRYLARNLHNEWTEYLSVPEWKCTYLKLTIDSETGKIIGVELL